MEIQEKICDGYSEQLQWCIGSYPDKTTIIQNQIEFQNSGNLPMQLSTEEQLC